MIGLRRSPSAAGTSRAKVVTVVAVVVAPLTLSLAALGGVGSFSTVREMAEPYFGGLAWIVPIGMDLGILILLVWDLLLEFLDMPWSVLRWVAWAYIAGTVMVNVAAAHGHLAGGVMHAAMPVLFITVVEGVRHLIRRWVGLTSGSRIERVPAMRWLLAPVSSLLLWRRMILWHITGYRQGLDLEYRHLLAVSELQQQYGRWMWRWRAPLDERLSLRKLPTDVTTIEVPQPGHEPAAVAVPSSSDDDEMMPIARRIRREMERQGIRFTRDELGDRLRALGYSIANKRVAKLAAVVRAESSRRDST
ncbi:hypothetical protein BJF79_08730 [Actinomadura sp. CNU-125]|uniref:DUF2637 domain-containing protein n=1 Tax=Actinomadura sp. CNU-125 TaxID=1904961 RepID=UPI000964FC48|nr:DUF2637 domain-containing protein [Actinomadura sp. CNU-125]OLT31869.1 hypothetical protein BJF79_08730 [Actinomadura sp. CNU-125]